MLGSQSVADLISLTLEEWRAASRRWQRRGPICLLEEVEVLLCRAVCRWAGLSLGESEVVHRARQMVYLIEAPAGLFCKHWRGRFARLSLERWAQALLAPERRAGGEADGGSALRLIANHRDEAGRLLPLRVAAVELINILRPTVAVSRFIVFAALALHQHPEEERGVREGGSEALRCFVEEVRRTTPFFPFIAARARQAFSHAGYNFPRGRRVLLDLYGTNHHPELWEEPYEFRPQRFLTPKKPGLYSLVPQGGGEPWHQHRCAGEALTVGLIGSAVQFLTREIEYAVPAQNLHVRLNEIPARPASGFMISGVRPRKELRN